MNTTSSMELTTLGGGCFWCLEAVFENVKGVQKITSGYAGGHQPNPTYEQVCSGTTGHAEVVQLSFDTDIISYREILEIFFDVHDPTTLNRQGADVGTQYRSVIFYHDEQQMAIAKAYMEDLESRKIWEKPIVTQLVPYDGFYTAEAYHQQYFRKNPAQPYCAMVVAPKVRKLKAHFPAVLRGISR